MRRHLVGDLLVTAGAQRVGRGRQLGILVDVGFVRVFMAVRACRTAATETGTLPQAEGVVRKPSWTAVRPVRRVVARARVVFEPRHGVVVVVASGLEFGADDVAQRVALRADHAARFRIETRRPHDELLAAGSRRRGRVRLDVGAAGPVTPFARGPEIAEGGVVLAGVGPVVVVLFADVAADTVLVPLLHRVVMVFVRPDDVHVVHPLAAQHVPGRWQDDDFSLFNRREVMLNAAAAKRVLNRILLLAAGDG